MDSDSDETIILESGNESTEVEEVPVDSQQVLFEQIAGNSNAPLEGSQADNLSNVNLIITDSTTSAHSFNVMPRSLADPQQNLNSSQNEAVELAAIIVDNDENSGSESLSLLNVCLNGNQEVVSELPHQVDSDGQPPKKRPHIEDDNEDDGTTCPICLDNWTNLGDHRICALKCGHLFGLSCITRWFASQKKKNCPTCKKKACRGDIRYIYAKKLIAMDATELEEIKKQLDAVTEEKNKIQIELTRAVCREHLIVQQVEDLKKKVQYLDSALEERQQCSQGKTSSDCSSNDVVRLYMDKSLEICKEAGCRVLDYCSDQQLIVASMKSPNSLFPGFGVRKINLASYRPTAFIPLHSKPIRDVRFHPTNPWLLSVSLDKTVKIVDTMSNSPISVYTSGEVPLWSCCWDMNNSYMLYVGKQQGTIAKFDMRQMAEPVCILEVPGDMSPVVSVAPIAICPGSAVPYGGVVSCKLNSLWVFENTPNAYVRYPLALEGPFISMTYNNSKQQLLVSTRSNSRYPYSRHHLCSIESGAANTLLYNTIHCFAGSSTQKLLSRSCLVSNKSNCYVAAHQESNKSVFLWSVTTGYKSCSLPAYEPVLDLLGIACKSTSLLASLTERKLELFKFV